MSKRKNIWKKLIALMLVVTLSVPSVYIPARAEDDAQSVEITEETSDEAGEEQSETDSSLSDVEKEEKTETEGEDKEEDELSEDEMSSETDTVEDELEEITGSDIQIAQGMKLEGGNEDYTILAEVEEERNENSKTFLLDNGTFMVAQYEAPVHYEEEDGSWQEIDYTLASKEADAEDVDGSYETTEKAGKKDTISFSKKAKEGKTVRIKGDYPISWGFAGTVKQKASVESEDEEEKLTGNNKFLVQDGKSQKIIYENIYDGVDAEYSLTHSSVKENLVLKKSGTISQFEMLYDIGKLDAVQKDVQTIQLMDREEVVYEICAPYMVDAKGQASDKVTLSIKESKKGKLTVQMTADEEWLSAEEREFPVVIDPVISTKTTKSDINSTFITSGMPNTNHSTKFELLVGRESSEYEYCRALFKINLPKLNPGDMVVNAKLNLVMYKTGFYASSTPSQQINAHRVTKEWTQSNVTWNNRPTFSTTVLDYQYIGKNDISNKDYVKSFDVTEAVKGWYEGTYDNYGIEIKMEDEESTAYAANGAKAHFWQEQYNEEEDLFPRYLITYRNNKGLENYWTYTTLSAGTAGTAYINDYTGNLVFVHEDVATTGERMPATLQHVYNGYQMNKLYGAAYPTGGRGWKMNLQQTLKSSSAYNLKGEFLEAYPYAYEDGDGTVHFFYKKTEDGKTKYYDEDGLGLELTFDGDYKYITDKEKNVMKFGKLGNLVRIEDIHGNAIKITYIETEESDGDDYKISKITDGSGHVITFTNNSSERLSKITDPQGRITTYTYTRYNDAGNASLTKILYPDGTYSTYSYDSDGAIVKAISSDGSGLQFEYTSKEEGKRVKKVTELATDGSGGQSISFDRTNYNTTDIRTSGKDDTFGNEDDLITTYQFDNFGRTVSTETKTADKTRYGGEIISYTAGAVNSSGSNIKSLNRVSDEAYSEKYVRNLFRNHNAEKDANWGKTNYLSTAEYTSVYDSSEKMFGNQSLKVTTTSIPGDGGAGRYQYFDSDVLVPGNTYTFSSYVKISDLNRNTVTDQGFGACLAVRYRDADGTVTKRLYSEYITETWEDYNNGWRRISITFTVDPGTERTHLYLLLRNATGTAWFDGMQLESGSSMNSYNMLENSSFDHSTDELPNDWELYNANSSDKLSTSYWISGGGSLKITGEAGKQKRVYQDVKVSGTEDDIYIVSGWAKADALPDAADGTARSFEIAIRVTYEDGHNVIKSKKAVFNRDVGGWQRASAAFNLKDGDSDTDSKPTEIRVSIRFYKQENNLYLDNIQLVKDVANSYTYDGEGNIITSKENGEKNSAFGYDSNNNLTSVRDAENNLYKYTYNDKKQVKEAQSPMGQKILFTYNSKGTFRDTVISSEEGDQQIKTENLYNSETEEILTQAYVIKTKDQNGYETTYDIDYTSGRQKSVITPDGVKTTYNYDLTNDLLTDVSSGGSTVAYEYDEASKTKLESIVHNGFRYGFTYDKYGNVVSTSVAGKMLSTNIYGPNNGKLMAVEYGNGGKKSYTYNKAGNIVSEKVKDTKVAEWSYDYSQKPLAYKDLNAEQEHAYAYDSTGRLLESKTFDMNATSSAQDSLLYRTMYAYDTMDRVQKMQVTAGGKRSTSEYSYNENGQPSKVTLGEDRALNYSYDTLGRLSSKELTLGTPLQYNYQYHLSNRNGEGETLYQTTQLKDELLGNIGYRYTYDVMGNITSIAEGSRSGNTINNPTVKVTYEYDAKNQLTRENNLYLNQTIVYTYDDSNNDDIEDGNLVNKKIYAYTTSEDLTEATILDTISYGYAADWKDQLVAYDSQEINIEYDAIGNPTKYMEAELRWTGRTLDEVEKNGVLTTYRYDASGLRTGKKVGTEQSEYYYAGGQLAYEKRGDKEFHYRYDADGSLVSIQYINGNSDPVMYYTTVNSRGDVEALYNGAGILQARYTYDSWGKVISITDANGTAITDANHIGNLNAIRYRGYYYDAETGFYYVSSRYYDPEVGRFISADTTDILFEDEDNLLQYNLYAYCWNNPVNMEDSTGESPSHIIGGILGAVGGAILGVLLAKALGWTGAKRNALIIAATIGGAALGAVLGPYVAKCGKKIASILNSALRKASKAALKASKKVKNFTVSAKHLANAGGRYRKFNTTSQSQIRTWIKQALKSSNATFHYNTDNSYYVIVNMGKTIGTKGERCIKVVFDAAGKIWTAYPTK